MNEQQVLAYGPDGKAKVVADGFVGNDIVVAHNGNVYVTNPPADSVNAPSKIWLIKPDGNRTVVDTGLKYSNGITLSPDQTLLYVSDYRSHWVYSYVIQPDGTLQNKQRFYWLHVPDTSDQSNADGLRVDREGRLYVATEWVFRFAIKREKYSVLFRLQTAGSLISLSAVSTLTRSLPLAATRSINAS